MIFLFPVKFLKLSGYFTRGLFDHKNKIDYIILVKGKFFFGIRKGFFYLLLVIAGLDFCGKKIRICLWEVGLSE
jgi:hypothetical protein